MRLVPHARARSHDRARAWNCEIAQVAQVPGQPNPISRVAIGRPVNAAAARLQIQLPVNASFAAGVRVQTDDKDPGVLVPFRRCVPAGCFAATPAPWARRSYGD
jgi:invasion protein IalB